MYSAYSPKSKVIPELLNSHSLSINSNLEMTCQTLFKVFIFKLLQVSQWYELVVFTASMEIYGTAVADKLVSLFTVHIH